jgi:hypothetical protein
MRDHTVPMILVAVVVSATISGLWVALKVKPPAPMQGEVTVEELEKTKLILGFAERNCKKLGFRVEGSGAFVAVTCGVAR